MPSSLEFTPKKKEKKERRTPWFRKMSDGPDEATQHQVYQYMRAYILDLFGSLLFTDSSGDSVPAMYLQFLRDLDAPVQYNWGGAVLALLYRNLCRVVTRAARMPTTIWGPMVLLQHWAWSRLPCGSPRALNNWEPTWGHRITSHALHLGKSGVVAMNLKTLMEPLELNTSALSCRICGRVW